MNFLKKTKELRAVCTGRCGELKEIPDEAFAEGMLGQGVAMYPTGNLFFSPCEAVVESVAETGHAVSLRTKDGMDLLIHVGVDTVTLKGEGFRPLVKTGETVAVGTPLLQADLRLVASRGLPTVTAFLISNPEITESIEYRYGEKVGGQDTVLSCRIGRKG